MKNFIQNKVIKAITDRLHIIAEEIFPYSEILTKFSIPVLNISCDLFYLTRSEDVLNFLMSTCNVLKYLSNFPDPIEAPTPLSRAWPFQPI